MWRSGRELGPHGRFNSWGRRRMPGTSKALDSLSWQSLPSQRNCGALAAFHLLRIIRQGGLGEGRSCQSLIPKSTALAECPAV